MSSSFSLRSVSLVTRKIDGVLPFYRDTLGLVARRPDARTLTLHFNAAAPAVITFTEDPNAREPAGRTAGLFHIALVVPDRPALAAVLARLIEARQPLEGLSDHGVSEAFYVPTALALIAESGPDALAARHVAARAGLTSGAIYGRYENADELLC